MLGKSMMPLTAMCLAVFLGSATAGFAAPPAGKGGGKGKPGATTYLVEMFELTDLLRGILSIHVSEDPDQAARELIPSCQEKPVPGGLTAEREKVAKDLTILHARGPAVVLDLVDTGIAWSRQYPVADEGVFDGCFGRDENGHFQIIIFHPKGKKLHDMQFEWEFELYSDETVLEHFTLTSERIVPQMLDSSTGERIPSQWHPDTSAIHLIAGVFDIDYSLTVNGEIVADHESLTTNGEGVYLEFWLHTCGLQSCL